MSHVPVKLKLQVPLPGGQQVRQAVPGIRNLRITVFPGVGDYSLLAVWLKEACKSFALHFKAVLNVCALYRKKKKVPQGLGHK